MWELPARIRSLVVEQFGAGGATIDTPVQPGEGKRDDDEGEEQGRKHFLSARTVVQPDGDLLCVVTDAWCMDPGVRIAHQEQVTYWFRASRSTVAAAERALRRAAAALGAFIAVAVAVVAGTLANLFVTLVVFVVAVPTGRIGFTVLLRALLRRRVNAVLRPRAGS